MKYFLLLLLTSKTLLASEIDNVRALHMALDDEYKAKATYQKVIEDFGDRKPFTNIINSEQRHIEALMPFFEKYGVHVPSNPYLGKITGYNSFKEACLAGVNAEVENVALYDKIYSMTDDSELIAVFNSLQSASQNKHLPAFQRCAR